MLVQNAIKSSDFRIFNYSQGVAFLTYRVGELRVKTVKADGYQPVIILSSRNKGHLTPVYLATGLLYTTSTPELPLHTFQDQKEGR